MTIEVNLNGAHPVSVRIESRIFDPAAERRIESLLKSVWSHIHPNDQIAIARHWNNSQTSMPKVAAADPWWDDFWTDGMCEDEGRLIWLNWTTNRLMPDDVVEATLAHEMAHTWQWAIGKDRFALTNDDLAGTIIAIKYFKRASVVGRVELHADETILRWGYDPLHSVLWKERHLKPSAKDKKWTLRKKPLQVERSRKRASKKQTDAYYLKD